jgi:hypothetical protein
VSVTVTIVISTTTSAQAASISAAVTTLASSPAFTAALAAAGVTGVTVISVTTTDPNIPPSPPPPAPVEPASFFADLLEDDDKLLGLLALLVIPVAGAAVLGYKYWKHKHVAAESVVCTMDDQAAQQMDAGAYNQAPLIAGYDDPAPPPAHDEKLA